MTNDTISDMLTRLRNAVLARQNKVRIVRSKTTEAICKILQKEGFIVKFETYQDLDGPDALTVTLKYKGHLSAINVLKRQSKSSLRLYMQYKKIPRVLNGMGLIILSTPQGILSGREAKLKKVGGEVLCSIW